jgi:phenylacetate-CoA ligase
VEELILREAELVPHYQLEVTRPRHLDEMTVHVERAPGIGGSDGDRAGQRLREAIKNLIGVTAGVEVVAPGGIERSLGKARRVVDRRPR